MYKITNKIYIGYTSKTIQYRWNGHLKEIKKGTNRKLYDAIRKYGVENFEITEIDRDDSASIEDWLHLETLYIIVHDSVDNGYNMTYGGIGGNTIFGRSMKGKTFFDKWVREIGEENAKLKNQVYIKKYQ